MADQQFLHEQYRSMVLVDSSPKLLIEKFYTYQPPSIKTYIRKDQT